MSYDPESESDELQGGSPKRVLQVGQAILCMLYEVFGNQPLKNYYNSHFLLSLLV